jgi:hypothetical protein
LGHQALLATVVHDNTATATKPCEFLTLRKYDFQQILQDNHVRETSRLVSFLKGIPLFSGWTKPRLNRLVSIMSSMTCVPGQVLVKQGDTSAAVYFVRKGTLELRVRLGVFV